MKGAFLFWVVLLLFWGNVKAQTVDLRFLEFELNNDLSSVYVTSLEQDKLGFMWFGTTNGLHRFDGYEFKKYLSDEGLDFNITESHIFELFADSYNWLWISLNSNLCFYNALNDSIKVISNEKNPNGLDSYYVTCYKETSDSVLYVSTAKAIYRFDRKSMKFSEIFKTTQGEISNFIIDDNGLFWISCRDSDSIYVYNTATKEYTLITLPSKPLKINSIVDLEFYDHKLWIATDGAGVISYLPSTQTFKNYPSDSEYSLNIQELYIDKDNFLWEIDFTSVKLYVKDRDFFQGYYPEDNNEYSIKPYAKNILQDNSGNYWTIHSPGGIGFSPKPKGINRFDKNINSPFHLSVNNLSTICEDRFGNLWMGNPFNGIDVFNWSKGRTITYYHSNDNPNSLGKGATQCIFRDSKDRMWIGSYWGGLQQFRPETEDFISYIHDSNDKNSPAQNDVRSITEDKKGNLWLCIHGYGIDKFNPESKTFTHYTFANSNLANDYTFEVICDSANNIWVATAWGVSCLKDNAKKFTNYYYDENDDGSLSTNVANTIYEDPQGRIWIGTPKGLNLFQPESNTFKRYIEGLINKNVVSITSDNENRIWMGTYFGLSRLDPETETILNLSKDDGLISNSFNPRCIFNNGINTIFLGSVDGLNYFDPTKIRYNNQPPAIYFTNFKVSNTEQNVHTSQLLRYNIIQTQTIDLNHKQNNIEIEFTALNYVGTERNNYAYYLEGFEKQWNYVGNKHNATYTNLNPGKYIFKVKACNNEGVWNEEGIKMELNIIPPFWDTILFRSLIILIAFFLLIAFIRFREQNLKKANVILEKRVQERTVEISSQKNELEAQKIELEKANNLKNRFFSILAHDLRGPVMSIMQLNSILAENKDQYDEKTQRVIRITGQTAENTHKLLEDLLIWGKSQTNNIHFDFENLNLHSIVTHATRSFNQLAVSKDISIKVAIDSDIEVHADSNTLKVVLRNLISNAIKFSYPQSTINISSEVVDNKVELCVADNGTGMPADILEKLFGSQIKYSSTGTNGEKGSGLGLALCKELVNQNDGKIWAESEAKKGSKFFFTVPLAKY